MKTWVKVSTSGLVCLIVGAAIGAIMTSHLMTSYFMASVGDNVYRNFEFSFERLASRDGVSKSPIRMQENELWKLAQSTVILGQQFDRIGDPQVRADAVRIAKLIEANPQLQGQPTEVTVQNAAKARQCIIEKSSNPSAVVQCVHDSYVSSGPIAHF